MPRMQSKAGAALRRLPAVSRALASRPVAALVRRFGLPLVTDLVRDELARLREAVRRGDLDGAAVARAASASAIAAAVRARAGELLAPRPRRVVNATGVVVHTNLGRSVMSAAAARRVAEMSQGYVDLEYDLERGARGSRQGHLEPLMSRLFPGQDFLVVNNNAAAILLCLRALSRGKEVLISRGELVEIGGSFRVPDILAASGARLHEVGTTNRTRLADYEKALSRRSGAILKVHTSNFRIVGFTEETSISKLAGLAGKAKVPLVVDWGSGDLVDLAPLGIRDEMPVGEVLAAGADLVTFSGDKLLGGPQAGFVIGRSELVARLRRDPMARVCRLDRLLVAALHETLASYVRDRALEEIPTLRMLSLSAAEIEARAASVMRSAARASGRPGWLTLVDGVSRTGGGSSPTGERPTKLIAVGRPDRDAVSIERRLRAGDPPVIGRVQEGRLLLDLRTVRPDEDAAVSKCLGRAMRAESGETAGRARKK